MKTLLFLSFLVISSIAQAQDHSESVFFSDLLADLRSQQQETPVDSNMQKFISSGTIKIFQNDKESIRIGSGFFLEEDFPLLHTAFHVVESFKRGRPIFLQLPDRTVIKIKAKTWTKNTSHSNYDHAVLDLSSHAKMLQKRVKKFRRAQDRPRFLERFYSSGFPFDSIPSSIENESKTRDLLKSIPLKISKIKSHLCYAPGVLKMLLTDHLPAGAFYSDLRPTLSAYLAEGMPDKFEVLLRDPESVLPKLQDYQAPAANYKFYDSNFATYETRSENFIMKNNYCGHGEASHGMSGGPLLNSKKEVIGLNSKGGDSILLYPDLTNDDVFFERVK